MKLRTMCVAIAMGMGVATLQAQAVGTPLQECDKAGGKAADSFYKLVGKAVKSFCEGKFDEAAGAKAEAKGQKIVDKLAKANEKDGCVDLMGAGDIHGIDLAGVGNLFGSELVGAADLVCPSQVPE